jgi:hypothetical protein
VVDDAEQHQGVHHHPLKRPPRQLRGLHHVHLAGALADLLRAAGASLARSRLVRVVGCCGCGCGCGGRSPSSCACALLLQFLSPPPSPFSFLRKRKVPGAFWIFTWEEGWKRKRTRTYASPAVRLAVHGVDRFYGSESGLALGYPSRANLSLSPVPFRASTSLPWLGAAWGSSATPRAASRASPHARIAPHPRTPASSIPRGDPATSPATGDEPPLSSDEHPSLLASGVSAALRRGSSSSGELTPSPVSISSSFLSCCLISFSSPQSPQSQSILFEQWS